MVAAPCGLSGSKKRLMLSLRASSCMSTVSSNRLLYTEVHCEGRHGERKQDHGQVPRSEPYPKGVEASHLSLGVHAIATTAYGLDEAFLVVGVDLHAQGSDEDLEGVGCEIRVSALNPFKQGFTGEHMAGAPHEVFQQRELPAGKRQRHASAADLAAFGRSGKKATVTTGLLD